MYNFFVRDCPTRSTSMRVSGPVKPAPAQECGIPSNRVTAARSCPHGFGVAMCHFLSPQNKQHDAATVKPRSLLPKSNQQGVQVKIGTIPIPIPITPADTNNKQPTTSSYQQQSTSTTTTLAIRPWRRRAHPNTNRLATCQYSYGVSQKSRRWISHSWPLVGFFGRIPTAKKCPPDILVYIRVCHHCNSIHKQTNSHSPFSSCSIYSHSHLHLHSLAK